MSSAPSQPTHSTPRLAQELIDNIIDELSSNKATLIQCSTVSRSFHMSSRRHLFYIIKLRTTQMVFRFHHLLISTPSIASNIRKLQIELSRYSTGVNSEGELVDLAGWLANGTLLANVLDILPCVQTLVWRTPFNWDHVSSALRSALVKLFQSPSIATVDISYVVGLPLSALHIVSPMKRLELFSTGLYNSDQKVHLPHLEVLKISQSDWPLKQVRLLVPSLRKFSLWGKNDGPQFLAQEAINASGSTLERFWWSYNLQRSNHINLQGLCCLQFLTLLLINLFDSDEGGTSSVDWGRNFHITSLLKDTSIRKTLKDLTIGIICARSNLADSDWRYLHDSEVWKDLNFALSSILPLERVLIHLHFTGYRTIPAQVWAAFRESMPQLEERGILVFKSAYDSFPERDMFTF